MKGRKHLIGLALMLVASFVICTSAEAIYLNKDKTWEVKGKFETKLTVATQGYSGWYTVPSGVPDQPSPANIKSFNMKQHRNIAYIEMNYNFKPGSGFDIKLHGTGRFLYEGVYEYGPSSAQEIRNHSEFYKEWVDTEFRDISLWEGYVDIAKDAFFMRIGRQKISWGETDVFPMLDRIMPIDNSYGGFFEDLDDRRVPIWALRMTYNFGRTWIFNDLGAELFWEPAMLDAQFTPDAFYPTIYSFPQASAPPYQLPATFNDSILNSRWGIRTQGILGNNFNWSLVYYQTYQNDPALLGVVDLDLIAQGDFHGLQVQKKWDPVQIVGGSFSFFEDFTDVIFRGEVGYFIDEQVFQISRNFRALGAFLAGSPVIPDSEYTTGDVFRFSIAMDRPFWVRFLNDKSMFSLSVEGFFEYYVNWVEGDYALAGAVWDGGNGSKTGDFIELNQWEYTVVVLLTTNYMQGTLTPTVVAGFNPRGAGFYTVSLEKRFGDHVKVKMAYDDVWGDKDIPPGVFFDWDQLSLRITYMF
jgi:hypothetical protein